MEYLAAEVLSALPEDLRDFVLRTSVLERLSAELCDVVTGRDDSGVMLEEADRRNLLLVALDDRRHWFRYHHLFADALRDGLHRADPQAELELHRRAAGWFEPAGSAPEALRHALAAPTTSRCDAPWRRHGTTRTTAVGWRPSAPGSTPSARRAYGPTRGWPLLA